MLGSTGKGEARQGWRWVFVCLGVVLVVLVVVVVLGCTATLPMLDCAAGGRDRGGAFSVNIRILSDRFTRCVSLTFTVTVITS